MKRHAGIGGALVFLAAALAPAPSVWALVPTEGASQPVSLQASVDRAEIRPGESFEIAVTVEMTPPYHIYALRLGGDVGLPTTLMLEGGHPFAAQGEWREPPPRVMEGGLAVHEGKVSFTLALKVPAELEPGAYRVAGLVKYMACTEEACLPPGTLSFSAEVLVAAGPARPDFVRAAAPVSASVVAAPPRQGSVEQAIAQGLWSFLLLAVVSGLLALLMPCVYPMIPITVSFFTKEAQRRGKLPVALAALYALGIVGTFTGIGLLFSVVIGVNIVNFVANPWVNLTIAALFFIFALSLFGLFEIQLPSFVVNAAGGADRSGALGVLVMGFAFSVASFTCTVQFVGTLLVLAAGGDRLWPVLGLLVFSATLATPFFFLSLFPSYIASVPRAGGWMHATKIVFGWIEIMAVMAYLAKAENVMGWGILSRPVVLAAWCFCTLITALYLFGWCTFRGEEPGPVGGPRRILAAAFAGLTLWIGQGFYDRSLPLLDAFLPPLDYGRSGVADEVWLKDLDQGLAQAKSSGKHLLLDFTGIT